MRLISALPARRRTAWVVLALAALTVLAVQLVPAPQAQGPRSSTGLDTGYESVRAERALAGLDDELGGDAGAVAVVVLSREDGDRLDAAALPRLTDLVEGSGVAAGVLPPPVPSPDLTVALLPVPLGAGLDDAAQAEAVADLRAALARVSDVDAALVAQVTGAPAFQADIAAVFEGADVTLLAATAAVVALLLFLTYRSPLLVVVPLVVVAAAEQTVLRLVEVVVPAVGLAPDPASTGIVSILVFGAATNYALLLVARYREELRVQARPADAMRTAVARAGAAILASGGTVVLAVLALLLADVEATQTLGVGAAVGVLVAVAAGLVVLPCALVVLGRAAFWPFVPRLGSVGREGRLWGRLGAASSRRPLAVALLGAAVIALLAAPAAGLRTGLSQAEQFRERPEAVSAASTLAAAFPAGAVDPVAVLTPTSRVDAVLAAATQVDGVVEASEVRRGDGTAQLAVVLDGAPTSERSFAVLAQLREAVQAPEAGGTGTVLGGTVAAAADVADAQARDRAVVLPVILAAVLLVLVVLLRALVAPVLLLAAVVGTYFSAVGAGWLVLGGLLGQPALDTGVLLLSFVFLVALGIDYSIFLTTRAREEAVTLGTGPGMLVALRATGGVITSAGVVLAAVFAVLGVLPVVTLTQIGVVVGIGVLVDTLVVRTLLVPASAFLLGERFWWPATVHTPRRTSTALMRAVVLDGYGGPEVLRGADVPRPQPGPGQVLVRVAAASVNPADWRLRDGRLRWFVRLRLPFVLGSDVAGTVVELGEGVDPAWLEQDVVAALPVRRGGGYAELAAVDTRTLARAPRELTLAESAALPLCGLTALQALRLADLDAGQRLLVHGASGGVGTLAVQLGRLTGATVTAVTSTRNVELVRGLGAHRVLDYTRDDLASALDGPGAGGFDVVLDAANALPVRDALPLLRPGGTLVSVNPGVALRHPRWTERTRGGRRIRSVLVRPDGADLAELVRRVDEDGLRPVLEQTYPLQDVQVAHRRSATGRVVGKLVLLVDGDAAGRRPRAVGAQDHRSV